MKIKVNYRPTIEDVNITVYEDNILTYCNHADRYSEQVDYGYADSSIGDWREVYELCWVCDKCNWSEIAA